MRCSAKFKYIIGIANMTTNDVRMKLEHKYSLLSFGQKLRRGTFSLAELIELCEVTGNKVAILDKNNQPLVIFDEDDRTEILELQNKNQSYGNKKR